jgi:TonB family protein
MPNRRGIDSESGVGAEKELDGYDHDGQNESSGQRINFDTALVAKAQILFGTDSGWGYILIRMLSADRRRGVLLLPIAMFLFYGCVYFNTFFAAEQKFEEAERSQKESRERQQKSQQPLNPGRSVPGGPAGQMGQVNRPSIPSPGNPNLSPVSAQDRVLYEDAIKKASKVLKYHPNSRWIDDALWLIGKSYFNMADYILADRKFKELVTNHPESKYADDAFYYMGLCQMDLGHIDLALSAFAQIEDAPKKSPYLEDVYFAKGMMEMSRQNYSEALGYFSQYLDKFPGGDSAAAAANDIGFCEEKTKDYLGAFDAYQSVNKYHPDKDLYFDAMLSSASAALEADSIATGMRILEGLAGDQRYFSRSGDIHLKTAEGYYLQGNIDKALETYQEVVSQNPRTDESAEAFYRLGLIYQNDKFDFAAAKTAFTKAQGESPSSEFKNLALTRLAQIAKLETYQSQLQRADSLEKAEHEKAPAKEIVTGSDSTKMDKSLKPDSMAGPYPQRLPLDSILARLTQGEMIGPLPDTSRSSRPADVYTVPLDSLTVGEQMKSPKTAADSASRLAEKAKGDSIRQAIIESGIETRYLLAELYAYELNRPDSALREFLLIADEYKDSQYAAKSLLAAAQIEYDHQDTATGNGYLRKLIAEHPRSPQAAEAAQMLNSPIDLSNNAVGLYSVAESLVYQANNPDSAIQLFKYIANEFPDLAPKATFAVAWVLDQWIGVSDSSAYYAYSDVITKYPQSIYADAASERLSVKARPERRRAPAEQQQAPQQQEAGPDSLKQTAQGLPQAPRVKTLGEFLYPGELLSKDLKGRVIFKIKLDVTGRVEDYEIIGPSGEQAIDSSATVALLQTEFDVSQMNLAQLDTYYQYTVPFKRPDIDIFNDPYRRRQEGQGP